MPKQSIDGLARELERDLRAVRQILRRPIEAEIARGGLTGPQQSAMSILAVSDGMSLKELSKQLGLAHSTVSGIVDRLQKRQLVDRSAGEGDLRFTNITVSRQVREYLRDTLPNVRVNPLASVLRAATKQERMAILEGVQTLRRLLEARVAQE